MSSSRSRSPTLRRQLVVRICLIVAAVTIVISALSTFVVHTILVSNLDQQLNYAVHASDEGPRGHVSDETPDLQPDKLRLGGMPQGSISLTVSPGGQVTATVVAASGSTTAELDQIQALAGLARDGQVRTIHIDDLGSFRAVAVTYQGYALAVAAPLEVTESVIHQMIAIEALLAVLALGVAAVVSNVIVRASLRPLTRLADTASEVATLPLESGEVDLGIRVPTSGLDPTSEVGRVGSAFNSMLDNVESSLQARQASETRVREFVADASHELRNPLASIRGYAELTRRSREPLPSDTVFALGRIESESERMSRLVEQMLLLARLDNGPNHEVTDVDLTETVLNAVSDARAAGPGHAWTITMPDDPVVVRGDANQLLQVVSNLLSNARKHTPEGTRVDTSLAIDGQYATIAVTDNGPGIPEALRATIFERFTKADEARTHDREGSTGLGLAIVAAVAKAHGGSVTLDSRAAAAGQPGFSRFVVRLPLPQAHAPAASTPRAGTPGDR
ncbi:sensor histidine kinase [Brooklawnia cerclae]|uniref:histidine kinase n=1 Tax=Brooklawnia cerclae TaxID=349934 RepID=A0ABX0SMT4_9ACTN|nr:HAMP domain-containing sensor histidine kinase [Brooklawnia cerclae]NIH58350.1 two-component system OmpR family sensor kinase [Brooklawnia cerclae]